MVANDWKYISGESTPQGLIERYYNQAENKQVTIQPTYGQGRKFGKYEIVYFDLNKGIGGKTIAHSEDNLIATEIVGNFIRGKPLNTNLSKPVFVKPYVRGYKAVYGYRRNKPIHVRASKDGRREHRRKAPRTRRN